MKLVKIIHAAVFIAGLGPSIAQAMIRDDPTLLEHLPYKLREHAGRFVKGFNKILDAGAEAVSTGLPESTRSSVANPLATNPMVRYIQHLIHIYGLDGKKDEGASAGITTSLSNEGLDFNNISNSKTYFATLENKLLADIFAQNYDGFIIHESSLNNPIAQYLQGLEQYYGIGKDANPEYAQDLFRKAANHGTMLGSLRIYRQYYKIEFGHPEYSATIMLTRRLKSPENSVEEIIKKLVSTKYWKRLEINKFMDALQILPGDHDRYQDVYESLYRDICQHFNDRYEQPLTWGKVVTSISQTTITSGALGALAYFFATDASRYYATGVAGFTGLVLQLAPHYATFRLM